MTVFCSTARELEGIGGHYFINCFSCQPSTEGESRDMQDELWGISEKMVANANSLCEIVVPQAPSDERGSTDMSP